VLKTVRCVGADDQCALFNKEMIYPIGKYKKEAIFMKRRMAVISALLIGIGSCAPEMTVMAIQNEGKVIGTENLAKVKCNFPDLMLTKSLVDNKNLSEIKKEEPGKKEELLEDKNYEKSDGKHENLDKDYGKLDENPDVYCGKDVVKASEMKELQIPQKLDVVIDPWELDEKGQIYSEQYAIKNTGEMTGILTLSHLTCRPQDGSHVIIRTNKEGLRDNKEKSLYMEMLFGNDEQVVLSEDGAKYQTELKPGEELSFCFSGEVNEYVDDEWKKGDIEVGAVYSWEIQTVSDNNGTDEVTGAVSPETGINDAEGGESENSLTEETVSEADHLDAPDNTIEAENKDDSLQNPEVDTEGIPFLEEIAGAVWEAEGNEDTEGTARMVDLSMVRKARIYIDSWKFGEGGNGFPIVYAEYVMQNTGDQTGILTLSELDCRIQELGESRETIDREEVSGSLKKCIYIELLSENGTVALSQNDSDYKVQLEPGENITVRFAGEVNEDIAEVWNTGAFEVSALCFWNVDDTK
jgi:hypothetical protein